MTTEVDAFTEAKQVKKRQNNRSNWEKNGPRYNAKRRQEHQSKKERKEERLDESEIIAQRQRKMRQRLKSNWEKHGPSYNAKRRKAYRDNKMREEERLEALEIIQKRHADDTRLKEEMKCKAVEDSRMAYETVMAKERQMIDEAEVRNPMPPLPPPPVLPPPPAFVMQLPNLPSVPELSVPTTDDKLIIGVRLYQKQGGKKRNKLIKEEVVHADPNSHPITSGLSAGTCTEIPLVYGGGVVRYYPSAIQEEDAERISSYLLSSDCDHWRSYVSNGKEPRLHFLVVPTDCEGCGYAYNTVKMKGVTPERCGSLGNYLNEFLEAVGNTEDTQLMWSLDAILYRSDKDHINKHADNKQGEQRILCIVIQSNPRIVEIESNESCGDIIEKITLLVRQGEAYEMDQSMQKYYQHQVPKMDENVKKKYKLLFPTASDGDATASRADIAKEQRLALIFRLMKKKVVERDSGVVVTDTCPPQKPSHAFGHVPGIEEGNVYKKSELEELGAHLGQKGASGNKDFGTDAVLISCPKEELRERDRFVSLLYTSSNNQGAKGTMKTGLLGEFVRVFRSSKSDCKYPGIKKDGSPGHRYDGLYKVDSAFDEAGNLVNASAPAGSKAQYTFHLVRAEKGTGPRDNKLSAVELYNVMLEQRSSNGIPGVDSSGSSGSEKMSPLPPEMLKPFDLGKIGKISLDTSDSRRKRKAVKGKKI